MNRTYDGYASRTHPCAPLYPQPHGYLRGRREPATPRSFEDMGALRVASVFSARLAPSEYARRRTWRR